MYERPRFPELGAFSLSCWYYFIAVKHKDQCDIRNAKQEDKWNVAAVGRPLAERWCSPHWLRDGLGANEKAAQV